MSVVDDLRDALYGNPPSPTHRPTREGVLASFSDVVMSLNILAGGVIASTAAAVYATRSELDDDLAFDDRTLGLVYDDGINTGIYIKSGPSGSGSWTFTGLLGAGGGSGTNLIPLIEAAEARSRDLVNNTRDPLLRIRHKINEASLGGFTVNNGDIVVTKQYIVVSSLGNSLFVGQGAQPSDSPGEIFCDELRKAFPWVDVYHDNYAIPGSWFANFESLMIDDQSLPEHGSKPGILKSHQAAMAPGGDGRRRMPDIVLMGTPSNDSLPNLFNAAQPPYAFNDISNHLLERLTGPEFNAMVIGYNGPMYDVKRALLLGDGGGIPRMLLGPSFTMLWPFNGFYGFDDTNVYTYDVASQTITSAVPGIFEQGLFDNNLLTADGRSWLWVDEFNKTMRIIGRDSTNSILTVDDGAGGPAIPENRTSLRGVRQGNFDNYRQVIPIRNNDDLSRPATAPADAPLAIESRPFGPNGEYVNVSTRLTIENQIWEKNLARHGCYLNDWVGEQAKITTSDVDIENQYPTDEIHPGGPIYQLTRIGAREHVRRIAYGIRGASI